MESMVRVMILLISEIKAWTVAIVQGKAMKSYKKEHGVTLVEMIITVAIIAILVSLVVGVGLKTGDKGKEHLAKGTIAILVAAVEQVGDRRCGRR